MPLTVLSVAYPFAPVGPGCVGGAEQILTDLDAALTAAGHDSLVLAHEDSVTAGKLFPFSRVSNSVYQEGIRSWRSDHAQALLDKMTETNLIDLIHVHDMAFDEYKWPPHIPVLVTLHLPSCWYASEVWRRLPANLHIQCVSESQRNTLPPPLQNVPVVTNGVGTSSASETKEDFALVLGRICPEKNQHVALEAGFRANIPVILAGFVFQWPAHQRYFDEKVLPLLAQEELGVRHKFCGALDAVAKQRLLARARCLLHPTLAPETSSLVAMEALAAGTPVIAFRSGALADIIEEGITGFLVGSMEEMASAIHRVHTIQPQSCRQAAAERFSKQCMITEYFNLYGKLMEQCTREAAHG